MDTLKYSGKVKVTVYKNGKKIRKSVTHNEGFFPLFRFFADCLCSTYDMRNAPAYMQVKASDGSTTLPVAPLTQKTVQSINGYPTAMLQSTLKYSNTDLGVINNIQLLNSGKDPMAAVTITTPVELVSTEYSAVIQWYLRVDNSGESPSNITDEITNRVTGEVTTEVTNKLKVDEEFLKNSLEGLNYTVTKKENN